MTQTAPRAESPPTAGPDPRLAPSGRWAWLCGVVGGIAGIAVADLVAFAIAPAGAPVPAVGSMIINLLPAGLVNWGKETLGTADKPVLLVIIVLGVLALCGLAGRLEQRRAYGGGLVFAAIAAVGLIAVLTGGQSSIRAIVPTVLGLFAGYLLLRLLVARLCRWSAGGHRARSGDRGPGPAHLPDLDRCRGGRRDGRGRGRSHPGGHRGRCRGRPFAVPAADPDPSRPGARRCRAGRGRAVAVRDPERRLLPDRHRAAGADPGRRRLVPDDHRDGRSRGDDQLRRPDRQTAGRARRDAHLRLQRGGRRPDRQRRLARATRSASCWPRPVRRRGPTWCCPPARTAGRRAPRWRR